MYRQLPPISYEMTKTEVKHIYQDLSTRELYLVSTLCFSKICKIAHITVK